VKRGIEVRWNRGALRSREIEARRAPCKKFKNHVKKFEKSPFSFPGFCCMILPAQDIVDGAKENPKIW